MKNKTTVLFVTLIIFIILVFVVLRGIDSNVNYSRERTTDSDAGHSSQELPSDFDWEKSYAVAIDKAKIENKPLFVMMSATWCGWCKKLEKETLSDSTVRQSLKPFIAVKVYENEEINRKFGYEGYPTLAFIDSDENLFHRVVGYMDVSSFIKEVALAREKIKLKPATE
jgi:thioredoxin-related protein